MKIHQYLEQLFQRRVSQKESIRPLLDKVAKEGKFDDRKKNELITFILRRMADIEDELEKLKGSAHTDPSELEPLPPVAVVSTPAGTDGAVSPQDGTAPVAPPEKESPIEQQAFPDVKIVTPEPPIVTPELSPVPVTPTPEPVIPKEVIAAAITEDSASVIAASTQPAA